MNGATTVSLLRNLNSALSKKNGIKSTHINGQLNNSVGMQTGKNLFTDASAVARQNGDLPKFSSTKEDAPGYVPPTDSGKLKNVSELPGYQQLTGSSINIPGRNKAVGGAMAAATAVHTGLIFSGAYDKLMDTQDKATEYISESLIPKVKEIKAKVGNRIRRVAGMGPNIPPRA